MKKWYTVALFNLVVLALLGLLLRLKINFPIPFIEQDNILHAHSHFAFNGWIGFLLQVLIVEEFTTDHQRSPAFWNRFFIISTIVNYGMIVSFALTGYGTISIALSTLALWLSYVFAYKIFKAIPTVEKKKTSVHFLWAALFFLLLSSLGPYALSIIIATKSSHQYWYHNALYFFLHFQYNGWFTFSVLAFLLRKLENSKQFQAQPARRCFVLLTATCIPAYLFTSLWHQRPAIITAIIMITAILQASALFFLARILYRNMKAVYSHLPAICRWLYNLAIAAFVLKILLQLFTIHPQVAQLSFGFRPIIIGYLHLIFLAFVSMYLVSFLADKGIINLRYKPAVTGLLIFALGIVINEVLLAIQSIASISYIYIPALNMTLLANTFLLVIGALLLLIAIKKTNRSNSLHFINS